MFFGGWKIENAGAAGVSKEGSEVKAIETGSGGGSNEVLPGALSNVIDAGMIRDLKGSDSSSDLSSSS